MIHDASSSELSAAWLCVNVEELMVASSSSSMICSSMILYLHTLVECFQALKVLSALRVHPHVS
jgi:hypothetical protein